MPPVADEPPAPSSIPALPAPEPIAVRPPAPLVGSEPVLPPDPAAAVLEGSLLEQPKMVAEKKATMLTLVPISVTVRVLIFI